MLVGLVGKANVGKSTLFNALTHGNAAIGPYPFTTINPNQGIAFVSIKCVDRELGVQCKPRNGKCVDGTRMVPINVVDVAGIVPDAHKGRGMGIQFLNDLNQADALVCVVDASGGTDDEGRACALGTHDPTRDVEILETELDYWFAEIISRNVQKSKGKKFSDLAQYLSGIRVNEDILKRAISATGVGEEFAKWREEQFLVLAKELRRKTKPIAIAANKMDLPHAEDGLKKLKEEYADHLVVPVSADSELALRKAQEKGMVEYDGKSFEVKAQLPEPLLQALNKIKQNVLEKHGSTGVQELINSLAFKTLKLIVAYPVEDEKHYSDHFGNVLPDAILLPEGSTPVDLAARIHTDLAKGFLYAVNARNGLRVGKDHALANNDVIKIVSAR
jgi:hypothetical protein